MPDMCAGRYVTGVLQGPCEAWKVTVFIAASALWLHFSARCDPHVYGDTTPVHLPPYGMRTARPGWASLRRPTRGCCPVRAGRPGGAAPCKNRTQIGANRKNPRPNRRLNFVVVDVAVWRPFNSSVSQWRPSGAAMSCAVFTPHQGSGPKLLHPPYLW